MGVRACCASLHTCVYKYNQCTHLLVGNEGAALKIPLVDELNWLVSFTTFRCFGETSHYRVTQK